MIDRFSSRLGVSILAVALVAAPVAAKAPSLGDLVGGRASTGQSELESRGYIYISGHESGDYTKHSYYWNSAAKHCAHVVTADGRYTSITDGTRSDCNQKEDDGAGAAVAAVAGAALLAGILSHKSHHKEGATYDQTQTQELNMATAMAFIMAAITTPAVLKPMRAAMNRGSMSGRPICATTAGVVAIPLPYVFPTFRAWIRSAHSM